MKVFPLIAFLFCFACATNGQVKDSIEIYKLLQGSWGVGVNEELRISGDSIYHPPAVINETNRKGYWNKFIVTKTPSDTFSEINDGTGYYLVEILKRGKSCEAIGKIDSTTLKLVFQKDVSLTYHRLN